MGKRKKNLAVLLAAAMTVTMMCGMTTFAAPEDGSAPDQETETYLETDTGTETVTETVTGTGTETGTGTVTGTETETVTETVTGTGTETETETVTGTETETETETGEIDVLNNEEDFEIDNYDYNTSEDEYVPEPSVVMGSDNEEEPYVELDQSDDFVSLGEGKGSYQYTEGKLVLKDVNIELGEKWLPGFNITGTIVINLQGDNKISTKGYGINVFYGDLTINGDGTLTINCTGDWGDGIYVDSGSLTIDGAKVTVNTETKYGSDAITVYDGDVNIINGADVTANAKVTSDEAKYASVYGIHAWNGKINIKDSNVTAKADGKISLEGEMKDWIRQNGVGLYSQSYDIYSPDSETARPAGIVIDNSNVNASGSFAAMLVIGKDGTITIKDSSIIAPDDANIRALMATIADDPDAAAVQIGAILAKGEGPVDLDAIMEEYYRLLDEGDDAALAEFLTSILDNTVKDVKIVRDSELVTAEKSVSLTPQTGDSFHAETLLLVLAVSGCICAYLIRKKVIA